MLFLTNLSFEWLFSHQRAVQIFVTTVSLIMVIGNGVKCLGGLEMGWLVVVVVVGEIVVVGIGEVHR